MSDIAFDTGALIRLERDRDALRHILQGIKEREDRLTMSAAALTEFLGRAPRMDRGGADWIASHFEIGAVTEGIARRASTLMRAALDSAAAKALPGPIYALVVAEAERRGADVVVSGDRADFEALEAASERVRVIDIEDLIE
jgi:predicted nucleic acid-binding protein